MFSYEEALNYFVEEANIEAELKEIRNKQRTNEDMSAFQKMFSCCIPKPKLETNDLCAERDEVFAVAKVKYNS